MPRDPEGSTHAITGKGMMRVAVVDAPPLVWTEDGQAHGPEADLIRAFAATLGAEVEWHLISQEEAMRRLERFELHASIGGLTRATPWGTSVGLSRPYQSTRDETGKTHHHVIAIAPGENELLMRLDRFIFKQAGEATSPWQPTTRPATRPVSNTWTTKPTTRVDPSR